MVAVSLKKTDEPILLVGGHAVNVWALNYYGRVRSEIVLHEPLTSSDMDIYATRNALVWLHSVFFQAEDGIRDLYVTGVQTCALPI